eukprot:5337198-Amphidinium_carterae.1
MIDGCPQSATIGSELLLIQLTMRRNNPKTGIPEYLWRGEQEQRSFGSILRNAKKGIRSNAKVMSGNDCMMRTTFPPSAFTFHMGRS